MSMFARQMVLLLALAATPAAAVTPLDQAGSMAARAGKTIGAAAGCGIADPRLLAVSAKAIDLLQNSGASPGSFQ